MIKQIADVPATFEAADKLVVDLDNRHGRGKWALTYGGDPDTPGKPAIDHVVRYISEKYGVTVFAESCFHHDKSHNLRANREN